MQYGKMLNKIIAEKGYSGADIIRLCKDIGVKIDKGAFSTFTNGKAVPTEEKTRAIAKVCGVDERKLIIAGYLDKAPREIVETFEAIKEMEIIGTTKFTEIPINTEILVEDIKESVEKETLSDIVIDILDSKDDYMKFIEKGIEYKINDKINYNVCLVKPQGIEINDNAMFPIIQKGDKVTLEIKSNYKSSDILLILFEEKTLARYMYKVNNTVILSPINDDYKEIIADKEKIKVLGRVDNIIRKI